METSVWKKDFTQVPWEDFLELVRVRKEASYYITSEMLDRAVLQVERMKEALTSRDEERQKLLDAREAEDATQRMTRRVMEIAEPLILELPESVQDVLARMENWGILDLEDAALRRMVHATILQLAAEFVSMELKRETESLLEEAEEMEEAIEEMEESEGDPPPPDAEES